MGAKYDVFDGIIFLGGCYVCPFFLANPRFAGTNELAGGFCNYIASLNQCYLTSFVVPSEGNNTVCLDRKQTLEVSTALFCRSTHHRMMIRRFDCAGGTQTAEPRWRNSILRHHFPPGPD